MSDWETLRSEVLEVGGNNFIEVTLKQPPEGDNLLLGISKGWFDEQGNRRYKTNILIDKKKIGSLIELLQKVSK